MARKRRVIIVDDENDIREVPKACLQMVGGFDVLAAPREPRGSPWPPGSSRTPSCST